MELDLRRASKETMKVTLDNGTKDGQVIHVKGPKLWQKKMYDEILLDQSKWDSIDPIYDLASKIISNNVEGIILSAEELKSFLDIDDIGEFIFLYTDFVSTQEKNLQSLSTQQKGKKGRRQSFMRL